MKEIILNNGAVCLVDDCDFDLDYYTWAKHDRTKDIYYAKRNGSKKHERSKAFLMHRVILERKLGRPIKKGYVCHHINHNTLDNQRKNLEETTRQNNNQLRICSTILNKLGVLNIFKVTPRVNKGKPFFFTLQFNGKKYRKYCTSLEEAVLYRNKIRKSLQLSIPNDFEYLTD